MTNLNHRCRQKHIGTRLRMESKKEKTVSQIGEKLRTHNQFTIGCYFHLHFSLP
uniref:Uncharacterized protein n=1 Tax=Rhizophora mucronata TaxID=61149 RepID=A0A2P2PLL5_RHIMU